MKRIKIAPYGCIMHLTSSQKEWNRAYKKFTGLVYVESDSTGLTYDNGDGHYLVGVFDVTPNVIAHEIGHVCLEITDRHGLGDITKAQEQFCYLLGYLVGKSHEYLYCDATKGIKP